MDVNSKSGGSKTSNGTSLILFLGGAGIGALVSYIVLKKRYISKLNEELSSLSIAPEEEEKEETEPEPEQEDVDKKNRPFKITQQEYVEDEKYFKMTVMYYTDGVLADSFDNPMLLDGTIGSEALNYFDEEADDTVYVRNPELEIDYEVIKEDRTFASLMEEE